MSQTTLYLSFITVIILTFLYTCNIHISNYTLFIVYYFILKIKDLRNVSCNRYVIQFSSRSFSSASHGNFISQFFSFFYSKIIEDLQLGLSSLFIVYVYLRCYSQTENCQRTHFELTYGGKFVFSFFPIL